MRTRYFLFRYCYVLYIHIYYVYTYYKNINRHLIIKHLIILIRIKVKWFINIINTYCLILFTLDILHAQMSVQFELFVRYPQYLVCCAFQP